MKSLQNVIAAYDATASVGSEDHRWLGVMAEIVKDMPSDQGKKLVGAINHLFGNMLTPILGNLDMIIEGDAEEHEFIPMLKESMEAARDAHEVLKQILRMPQ